MPDPNTIGGVNFEVTASGAPQAQAAIKETARVANEATSESAPGAMADGEMAASKFLLKAGLIAATATKFFELGRAIREHVIAWLETGTEKADKFKASLDFSNVKGSLSETEKQLQDIQGRIAGSAESWSSWVLNIASGDTTSKLQEESRALEKTADSLRKAVHAREESIRLAKEEAALRETEARDRKAIFEQIVSQKQQEFDRVTEEKARKAAEQEAYELAEYEAKIRDQYRKEQEDKDRASLQRRASEARASFRATLADAANAAVGNEIVYTLAKIGGALDSIKSQTAVRDLSNGGFE